MTVWLLLAGTVAVFAMAGAVLDHVFFTHDRKKAEADRLLEENRRHAQPH